MKLQRTLILTRLESRLAPAFATWDGGGTNNNWTTAANWAGDVAPNPGDDLVFPAGAARLANTNDFTAGTAFQSVKITGYSYDIGGSNIALANGIIVDLPAGGTPAINPKISFPITLTAAQTFQGTFQFGPPFPFMTGYTDSGPIDLNGHTLTVENGDQGGVTTLSGVISGDGGIINQGVGGLILSGNNTFTGVTNIKAGQIDAKSSNALGATGAGNETIFEGFGELALGGVGSVIAETIDQVELFVDNNSTVTLNGPLTLHSTLDVGTNSTLTIAGSFGAPAGVNMLTLGGGDATSNLVFAATSTSSFTGEIGTVNALRMRIDGQAPGPVSIIQGTLSGSGTLGQVVIGGLVGDTPPPAGPLSFGLTPNSATLNPGTVGGIGTITTGDFLLFNGGRFSPEIGPGGTDRLNVHGTAHLVGFLDPQIIGGFTLSVGGHYRLIDNDGTDAVIGTFRGLPEGAIARTVGHVALRVTYHGGDGNDVDLVGYTEKPSYAVAAGEGGGPHVKVFGGNGTLLRQFFAYDANFRGGVHVATGDVTGDGIPDTITAPGVGGGPDIRVWDGATGAMIREFNAYDPNFRGGAWVAVGDVNGDGRGDIITGAGKGGGPHVKAFSGLDGSLIGQFLAYPSAFTGGVTVAVFFGKIVTGPGVGGGPDVRIFTASGTLTEEFDAFDNTFRGGIFVASGGSTNGATNDYLLITPGAGRAPIVTYSFTGADSHGFPQRQMFPAFSAYDAQFLGGVRVAAADIDGDGADEIITGAGSGGGPHVKAWHVPGIIGDPFPVVASFLAFDPAFTGGIFVG